MVVVAEVAVVDTAGGGEHRGDDEQGQETAQHGLLFIPWCVARAADPSDVLSRGNFLLNGAADPDGTTGQRNQGAYGKSDGSER
jgi:hypothetical protein